ncbi:MAG TPA: LLM class flavin-dependent oxidoreductase [Streptosporangiaceae bacterium]|nr:LLM class flavin-dependent oxidoreductase [Streptosporangiaceae bacterium]
MTLRFHWRLPALREAPDVETHLAVCRQAEEYGIESVLLPLDLADPEPFAWAAALGRRTERIRFIVGIRTGVSSPTYWTQQVNTLAAILGGRVAVQIATDWHPAEQPRYGDSITPEDWYGRADEFWQVCLGLWRGTEAVSLAGRHYTIDDAKINMHFVSGNGRDRPEIYVEGDNAAAAELAIRRADCLLTRATSPEQLADHIQPVLAAGVEAGLTATLPAWVAASAGSASADDFAQAILGYREVGVTQFVFAGGPSRPCLDWLRCFGQDVMPRVRAREASPALPGHGR